MTSRATVVRRDVLTLQLAAMTLSCGYGVMFAVLAKMRDAYGLSETMLGAIVGAGFFASFLAQILIAPAADRGHGRLLLVGGISCNVAGLLLLSVSSTALGFLLGRMLMGLGIGASYPAIRRSLTVIDPENVGKNMGGLLSFDVVGFLLGPVIAIALVGPLGIRWPYAVAAILSALFLPIASRAQYGAVGEISNAPTLALGLLRHSWMQASVCYGFAFFVMIGIFDALWAVRIDDLHGHDLFVTAGIIVFAAPLVLFGTRGGAFVERTGPFRTGAYGLLFGAFCLSLYGIVSMPFLMICIGVVHATSDAFTASSNSVAISLAAPPDQIAGAQGLSGAFTTLAGGFSAMAAGGIYDAFGPVFTYLGGAALMVLLVMIGWFRAGEHRSLRNAPATIAVPSLL